MYFIFNFGQVMLQSIWVLYTGYRYNWNTRQVGFSLALVGIMAIIVQLRLVRPILARIGEKRGLILGLLVSAVIMACYGLAVRGWMIYALIPLGALGGIAGPAGQALITKHVPADEQGSLQGSLAGLASLSAVFAPLLSGLSFGACIAPGNRFKLPGVAFFESAILITVALFLALASFRADAAAERASAQAQGVKA
jgi:DHA1 family tetracycline resistance protein-like MFS transporter